MKHNHTSPGFILIATLSIITLSIILLTYINNKSSGYTPFSRLVVDRQKAQMLAYGGVQCALSQLATAAQGTPKAKPTDVDHMKELLITVLPVHNKWQTFKLRPKEEGFSGELEICITCESGKIDINQIYDFKTKKFVGEGQKTGDYKKFMQSFLEKVGQMVKSPELFKGLEKFLKERQFEIQDITELLTIKEFEIFKNTIFYEPAAARPDGQQAPQPIYLTDLFTVWTKKATVIPWLLSSSVSTALNIPAMRTDQIKEREAIQEKLKNFALTTEWNAANWDKQLTPFYNVSFKTIPEFAHGIFNNTCDPTTFSVLSSAKVGTIKQRMLAIVQRDTSFNQDHAAFDIKIKKLYWL